MAEPTAMETGDGAAAGDAGSSKDPLLGLSVGPVIIDLSNEARRAAVQSDMDGLSSISFEFSGAPQCSGVLPAPGRRQPVRYLNYSRHVFGTRAAESAPAGGRE